MDFRTEAQDGMCNTIEITWTITPKLAPQPWIACGGCGTLRPFKCSNKVRLNANGRRLDAWLIYNCTMCDRTWNRTIFERLTVREIESDVLDALQRNDPEWIRAESFNIEALKRNARRIDEFDEIDVRREVRRDVPEYRYIDIALLVSLPTIMRLDRLLASELQISRSQIVALHEDGLLRTNQAGVLRRRIRSGARIVIDAYGIEARYPTLQMKDPRYD